MAFRQPKAVWKIRWKGKRHASSGVPLLNAEGLLLLRWKR